MSFVNKPGLWPLLTERNSLRSWRKWLSSHRSVVCNEGRPAGAQSDTKKEKQNLVVVSGTTTEPQVLLELWTGVEKGASQII